MNPQLVPVWKFIPHHADKEAALRWTRKNQRIAIGWGVISNLRVRTYFDAKEISQAIRAAHLKGNHPYKNWGEGGLSLWSFDREMKIGDLVIVSGNAPRQLVVRVTSDYEWVPDNDEILGNYRHQRKVELTTFDPDRVWNLAGGKLEMGRSPYATLARCANKIDIRLL